MLLCSFCFLFLEIYFCEAVILFLSATLTCNPWLFRQNLAQLLLFILSYNIFNKIGASKIKLSDVYFLRNFILCYNLAILYLKKSYLVLLSLLFGDLEHVFKLLSIFIIIAHLAESNACTSTQFLYGTQEFVFHLLINYN